jgi:hypothetical protein
MSRILTLATFALAFLLAGCDSVSERISARFEPVPPKARTYPAEQKVVFEAAQAAVRRIDFQLSRSASAQGIVDGISRIQPGDSFRDAKQHSIAVRIHAYEPGRTQVEVLVREQQESADFAGATNLPLREHGLYDSYFAALEQALREKGVKLEASAQP